MASRNLVLPAGADHVVVAVNPKAGARSATDRVGRFVGSLRGMGFHVEALTDLGQLTCRAAEWHAQGRLRALVGVGGDGTAAELTNRTPPGLPITMLPAGNENLLARYLKLPREPEESARMIAAGAVRQLDAGRANGRLFLLMVGCGFDAEVVRCLHGRRTGHVTRLTYAKPILDCLRTYEYPEIRIEWGDGALAGSPLTARWLFAFNLPGYGGDLQIAPEADGGDGQLDVCTFQQGGLWSGLRFVTAVLLGQHHRLNDFHACRADRLRLTSEAEVPYQLDGDPGGVLPVEIECLPQRLSIVVPSPC